MVGLRDDLSRDHTVLGEQLVIAQENANVIRGLIHSIEDPTLPIEDTVAYLRQLKRATITYYFRPTATTTLRSSAVGAGHPYPIGT